jgi:uncharacterized phage protein (TIGR01671 family)
MKYNRQLKFRIWDKQNNIFIYVWDASHKRLAISLNGLVYSGMYDDVLPENDYTIQQYTGLKDRDGKDIYEGDIIEHTFSKTTDDETSIHFGSKLNGSVSFCNHLCAYILTIISDDRHNGDTFQLMNHAPSKKIIGNVFENPELIKTNE